MIVVVATDAATAMSFAKRTDVPIDLGPPKDPSRYKHGARRWGWDVAPSVPDASILDRVRKLLALSERGGTEHEAANAAAAAQRLMATHNLNEAMLANDAPGDSTPHEEVVDATLDDTASKKVVWKGFLAVSIAKANGCKAYWRGAHLRLIGVASKRNVVHHMYGWAVSEIDRLATEQAHGLGRSYARSWRIGCAERLGVRIKEEAAAVLQEAVASTSGAALVRVNNGLARIEQDRMRVQAVADLLGLRSAKPTHFRVDAYSAGQAAGNTIRLGGHSQMGSGSRARLGGGS